MHEKLTLPPCRFVAVVLWIVLSLVPSLIGGTDQWPLKLQSTGSGVSDV